MNIKNLVEDDVSIFVDDDLRRRLRSPPRQGKDARFSEEDHNRVHLAFEYLRGVYEKIPRKKLMRTLYALLRRGNYDERLL